MQLGSDLTSWEIWWEFNKDPYIRLKDAVHTGALVTGSDDFFMGGGRRQVAGDFQRPTASEIDRMIVPALDKALRSARQRDVTAACLVALAKTGVDQDVFDILPLMRPHLGSHDQEIREVTALAMGISQMPAAAEDLIATVLDTPAARELAGRARIDVRTRMFAAYGLGLLGGSLDGAAAKRKILMALAEVLGDEAVVSLDLRVAVVHGIRMLRPEAKLLDEAVDILWRYYEKSAGQGEQQVQAHVPPAIAQMLGRGGDPTARFKDAFRAELDPRRRRSNNIRQSAVLALGLLCDPREMNPGDGAYSDALLHYFQDGRDLQSRWFALIALAKIGGESNRNELLKTFARGSRSQVKPWAAVALGVLAHHARQSGSRGDVDVTIGRTLHEELAKVKSGSTVAAIAIGLGLARYRPAADDLRSLLLKNAHRDDLGGYLCIGLALMDAKNAIEDIQRVAGASTRRPQLYKQASIALGKLGDKSTVEYLSRTLRDETHQNVAELGAVASAIGFIGDRRSIDPLVETMFDEGLTPLSRAFAAAALGGVADKDRLPWSSRIWFDSNYRAQMYGLHSGLSGIL